MQWKWCEGMVNACVCVVNINMDNDNMNKRQSDRENCIWLKHHCVPACVRHVFGFWYGRFNGSTNNTHTPTNEWIVFFLSFAGPKQCVDSATRQNHFEIANKKFSCSYIIRNWQNEMFSFVLGDAFSICVRFRISLTLYRRSLYGAILRLPSLNSTWDVGSTKTREKKNECVLDRSTGVSNKNRILTTEVPHYE